MCISSFITTLFIEEELEVCLLKQYSRNWYEFCVRDRKPLGHKQMIARASRLKTHLMQKSKPKLLVYIKHRNWKTERRCPFADSYSSFSFLTTSLTHKARIACGRMAIERCCSSPMTCIYHFCFLSLSWARNWVFGLIMVIFATSKP